MIFNKSILSGALTICEKSVILLEPTGEVVSQNPWALYVAQPVGKQIQDTLKDTAVMTQPICVSYTQLYDLCHAIPTDRQFKGLLEHVFISDNGQVRYTDAKGDTQKEIKQTKCPLSLSQWKQQLQSMGNAKPGNFVYNRKRLKMAVDCIETACHYDGKFSFVEQQSCANGCVWKCLNELTGQLIILAWVLPELESAVKYDEWHDKLFLKRKMVIVL